ncbi:hypothetical protein Q3W71_23980 [Micromonospora sp. C28SCA-DRY-2]|uniref:hypothetical protein n=1 Tax=Micromonospora sp. C28SCA-DRY-2 TaxID=3059522 RepID=UPI002676FD17|nr:hypothetical protein [Micromonospora sp. C28SCA-DRY-2]MDO3704727.1 hypothetical protein [Micromonospora sp. C28SCA-DRY-2]
MDDRARTQPAPLPYAEVTDEAYALEAAATFTVREFGTAVVLSGGCPRCQDPITFALVDSVFRREAPPAPPLDPDGPAGGTPAGSAASAAVEPAGVPAPRGSTGPPPPSYRTIFCTCEVAHPYRAEGQVGCGAYWTLRLDAEP